MSVYTLTVQQCFVSLFHITVAMAIVVFSWFASACCCSFIHTPYVVQTKHSEQYSTVYLVVLLTSIRSSFSFAAPIAFSRSLCVHFFRSCLAIYLNCIFAKEKYYCSACSTYINITCDTTYALFSCATTMDSPVTLLGSAILPFSSGFLLPFHCFILFFLRVSRFAPLHTKTLNAIVLIKP